MFVRNSSGHNACAKIRVGKGNSPNCLLRSKRLFYL